MTNLKQKFDKSPLFKDCKYGIKGSHFFPGSWIEIHNWLYQIKHDRSCYENNYFFKKMLLDMAETPEQSLLEAEQGLLEESYPKNLIEGCSEELSGLEQYKLQHHYEDWKEHYFQHDDHDHDYYDDEDDDDGDDHDDDYDDNWDEDAAWEKISYLFDWLDDVEKYFKERFAPITSWASFELYMSLFYKRICYENSPLLGALCDIETLAFNPIDDKRFLNPKFRQHIKNLYLNGEIEKALKLSGDLNCLKLKERNWPMCYLWFFDLFTMFINHPSERHYIKKELVRLFMENSWITESPAVKESVKHAFINKTGCMYLPPGLLREKAKLKTYSPDGFSEMFFFLFTLIFPELDIWEYKYAYEHDTVDLFVCKLKCLEYRTIKI